MLVAFSSSPVNMQNMITAIKLEFILLLWTLGYTLAVAHDFRLHALSALMTGGDMMGMCRPDEGGSNLT